MDLVAPAEFKKLDALGSDLALQAEFRSVIEEIAKDPSIAPHYDWAATAEFITESASSFLKELEIAYPVYSVFPEAIKVSFLSKNDRRHWQFALKKSTFLIIRENLRNSRKV
jgi:hypothetical protein